LLFYLVSYTYCAIDGEERLVKGLETALEEAAQAPVEVGIDTKLASEEVVYSHSQAPLALANLIFEVIVSAFFLGAAQ